MDGKCCVKCNYVLYKQPIQLETLAIVRYLHTLGIDARPSVIIERSYPSNVSKLPSIYDINTQHTYSGLDECIKFYENTFFQKLANVINHGTTYPRINA